MQFCDIFVTVSLIKSVRYEMKRILTLFLAILFLLPLFTPLSLADEEQEPTAQEDTVIVTSEGRGLKFGDKGEDVKHLQTRLKDLRYYSGPVTGNYLEATRKSVRAVQEAYGLDATGDADLNLQEIIYGDAHRPLKKGDSGKDVSRLQTRLSEVGYYWGKISGNFQDGTTAAIGNFQEANGLEKTGQANVPTLIKLYSDDIVVPTPDPNVTPKPIPTPPPEAKFTGTISYGDKNKQVTLIQERLLALGFFDRKVSGGFYQHTSNAVKNFQQYNGLVPDGVVGEQTFNVMFSLDVVRADGIPKPSPSPTPIPYAVEVDVTNQLIKIYGLNEQGEHKNLEKIFTASTGTTRFPSAVGEYTLTGRRARWAEFPNWGGGKARWWLRIDSEIAFHSVIYNSYNLNSVNMNSVRKLGNRASHGCIRLTVADAKWMYDNIGKGTVVTIREDLPLDPELKAAHKPGEFSKNTWLHSATPAPTQEPHYDGSRAPAFVRTLKNGSTGEDVFWIQKKLTELGYYKGAVTGTYLEGTRDAVRAFQRDNKLSVNGTADKKTQEALYTLVALTTTPAPTPLPTDPPEFAVQQNPDPVVDYQVEEQSPT